MQKNADNWCQSVHLRTGNVVGVMIFRGVILSADVKQNHCNSIQCSFTWSAIKDRHSVLLPQSHDFAAGTHLLCVVFLFSVRPAI